MNSYADPSWYPQFMYFQVHEFIPDIIDFGTLIFSIKSSVPSDNISQALNRRLRNLFKIELLVLPQ